VPTAAYPPELTTQSRDATGRSGLPWWADLDLPDHRLPGKDEWVGWDESAEEGPDEGRPYVGAGTGIPWDAHRDDPRTGPYPGFPPTRAEPDPRDLVPSTSWRAIRKTAEADPSPLLRGLGQRGCIGCAGLGQPAGQAVPWWVWAIYMGTFGVSVWAIATGLRTTR